MKISRIMMIFLAFFVVAIGSAFYVSPQLAEKAACEIAGGCGKCGDGYCNPRCGETSTSCPRDCGVVSTK